MLPGLSSNLLLRETARTPRSLIAVEKVPLDEPPPSGPSFARSRRRATNSDDSTMFLARPSVGLGSERAELLGHRGLLSEIRRPNAPLDLVADEVSGLDVAAPALNLALLLARLKHVEQARASNAIEDGAAGGSRRLPASMHPGHDRV